MIQKKQPRKIAYFSVNSFLGGAERATLNYCIAHKKKQNFEVVLITLTEGALTQLARTNDIQVIVLKQVVRFRDFYSIIKAIFKLRRVIIDNRIDIIHSSMAYAQVISSLACYNRSVKKVWYSHGPVDTIFDRIAALLSCDFLLYNSKFLRELHYKILKSFDVESAIIFPIVDTSREDIIKIKEKDFIFLGRISRFKGLETIIESVMLLKSENIRVKLSVFGKANTEDDRNYESSLKVLVRKYNLESEIIFMGEVIDPKMIFNQHLFLIHSSVHFEPFGMVIAEAMGSGLIPIFSSESSVAHECGDDIYEQIYDATSKEAHFHLKRIMEKFLSWSDSEINKAISINRNLFERKFSEEAIIEKLEKVYKEI